MLLLIFCLFTLVNAHVIPPQAHASNNLQLLHADQEDATLTVCQLIIKYGYPCEEYQVVTSDEYILTVHRIPHGRKHNTTSDRVVFLQHGILSSSADWIIAGPEKAFGYILADAGYDVWMGNARGNKLSKGHAGQLSPDQDEYWDFSWHEIGFIDIPTMIDFVLQQTGQENLFHIGHSQGTTTFYVMASMRPEYNKKIRAHFSLAPVAYMNHMTSPLLHIMSFWQKPLGILLNLIGVREFLPSNEFMRLGGKYLCGDGAITQILCSNALFAICGFSPKEMNASLLPIMTGHTPAGASTKQILHYAQEVNSGYFRRYSYGMVGNLQKYGSLWPPSYELEKITAPVYIFYSHNDWLSHQTDVDRLYKRLPNRKAKLAVTEWSFNHLDYVFGINAKKFVYDKVISLMQNL